MFDEISSGGMATVHLGRLSSDAGFSRTVAIKYLHPNLARDSHFISMFLDEARLVSRIRHPNVAAPLDVVVVSETEEVFLVMEYVHGETLSRLVGEALDLQLPLPPSVTASILSGSLHGLHAAHEAVDELGAPLNIVHRDVSPQNIIVGADGVPRVLDFGIAKAVSRSQSTEGGRVKGKVSYMAPEQLTCRPVDRRADIFAAGIVLWEALTMRRLFKADDHAAVISQVLQATIPRPSSINGNVSLAMDRVVLKALNRSPAARFQTARDFAAAIEEEAIVANTRGVSEWVCRAAAQSLAARAEQVARIESESVDLGLLDGQNHSVETLQTTSQTFAILRDVELRRRSVDGAKTPRPAVLRVQHWEDPTVVSASLPDGAAATPAPAEVAEPHWSSTAMPAEGPWTETVLAPLWRRKKWILGGAALGLVGGLATAGLLLLRSSSRPTADSSWSEPVISTASPQAIRHAVDPPKREVVAVAPKAPSPERQPAARAPTKSKRSRTLKSSKARRDCEVPFYVDRDGIRRVKPQCL